MKMITFVNFAAFMDDGEAATGAIAANRNWAIATDDRKAIRFLEQNVPSIKIVSTLELVKHWADSVIPPAETVQMVLQNIRTLARYIPNVNHPLYKWWEANIGGSSLLGAN